MKLVIGKLLIFNFFQYFEYTQKFHSYIKNEIDFGIIYCSVA